MITRQGIGTRLPGWTRSVAVAMLRNVRLTTFIFGAATCIAWEAVRINGWYNRHPTGGKSFIEVAFSESLINVLVIYPPLFLPLVVVLCNRHNPKVTSLWLLLSIATFLIACAAIPGAWQGRWGGTHDTFIVIYWLIVPLPALAFMIYGFVTRARSADTS